MIVLMKKWLSVIVVAFMLTGLSACANNGLKTTAHDYVKAIYAGDIDAATKLIYLREPGKTYSDYQGKFSSIEKDRAERLGGVKDIEVEKIQIDPDNANHAFANVRVTFNKSEHVSTSKIELFKDKTGDWKVKL